jgi:quercetin dioxygenase-like cupin family protein
MHYRGLTAAFAVLALVIAAAPASAQDATAVKPTAPHGYPAETLLSTSTTVLGEPLHYPKGAAHVTSVIVTLAPGERTILHKHGVPMFFYILDGEITVDYGKHGKRTYRKGQSQVEAMGVAHFGENTGKEPIRLIAVYMGASRAKDVIPVKRDER